MINNSDEKSILLSLPPTSKEREKETKSERKTDNKKNSERCFQQIHCSVDQMQAAVINQPAILFCF